MKRILAAAASLIACVAFAQAYPDRPIHLIVPFTAGSGTDIIGRTVGEALSKNLGQPVIIDNRPGAGGTVGAGVVARSALDGYTLLVHSAGHVANPAIYSSLPYDTLKDLSCVTPLASLPNVLVVPPQRGWKSVKDLVAAAQAKPGALNYGSAGVGSATHMNAEIFRQAAKFDAVHVPYKGTPEAMTETAAGRIDFFFAPLSSALPLVKAGRLQALAVGTATRSPVLPNVPTTVEEGYAQSEYVFWVAMIAPSGTPRAIVDKLNAEVVKALNTPAVKEKLEFLGAEPMPMTPTACDAFFKSEVARMEAVVKSAGIKAQ